MKNFIELENIKLYAYHGCMKEERQIGSNYRVDLKVATNFKKAAKTDDLNDAVDYVTLNKIVEVEMAKPANLLETVAKRIFTHIEEEFPNINKIEVKISKLTPPIDGDVEAVSVLWKGKTKKSK